MKCRHCGASVDINFLDLGFAPPSNALLDLDDLRKPEKYYPLRVKVCGVCWLVQTEDYASADELFRHDYAYFSSTSRTWLDHAAQYCKNMIGRLSLGNDSKVIEVAANDGYLLKNFLSAGIPCLGIEPTASTAAAAERIGINVVREFFGESLGVRLASDGWQADLIIGNNVFAHVPDINDFTRGLKALLKSEGVVTLEFPHLMRLIEFNQFDTVYHEHFSYLSLHTVVRIFEQAGLRVFDVEGLSTHGGSLRIYGCHHESSRRVSKNVNRTLSQEYDSALQDRDTYESFQERADKVKNDLLYFLLQQRRNGKRVVAYGAAAKGNTLLNYAGVKPDLLTFVCDAAVSKQGKFMPGSHIPILAPDCLAKSSPDFLLILPWNIAEEIRAQLDGLAATGTRFVTAVPELSIR